jgi:citrate synthase
MTAAAPAPEVRSGLEGVVAFATTIAEPDREGGALRYRGIDVEELVGAVPFEQVWGLLVDGAFLPGLPPAEPDLLPVRSNDARVDVQAALAMLGPARGFRSLLDISDEQARDDLARASVMALSFVAQSARGAARPPVPQREIDTARSIPERFLIRWRGEADPRHVKAIDAYWISAAEHGMNASTFTARVVASTGADVAAALSAAVGALSGPLHGGAPSRVLAMLDEVQRVGDAERVVRGKLDRGERLMGFGHRVYRAEDPRARVLRRTARELGSERFEAAEALERAALAELRPQARSRPRHERRVLVGRAARPRRGAGEAVHEHVHLRSRGRVVGTHPRAEARGPSDPPNGNLRGRTGASADRRGRIALSTRAARCGENRAVPPSGLLERPPHDVAERALILRREAGQRARRLLEALGEALADLGAALGDGEHLHAPVVRRAAALDEAAVLEAVDDARDVRVVAVQGVGELAHRDRPVGIEDAEGADLRRRELELGRDGEEAAARGVEQLVHERPGLAGRGGPAARRACGCHRATYGTYTDKSLTTSTGLARRVS